MQSDQILCVGDVHLGRRAARVPAELEGGLTVRELSPRAAFEALVDEALRRRVRALVFLGDVVDDEEHFLEAFGVLQRGVQRLLEGGVEVFAVAGNHDVRALPQLADLLPGFRLLGRGGRWERAELEHAGRAWLQLVGWSFPAARVRESPLASFDAQACGVRGDLPTVGLLHADLDASESVYAPVPRRALEALGWDAFLLGHVHAPMPDGPGGLSAARPLGYLGSLSPLDPTEVGVHGPCLLSVAGARGVRLERLPLAPLVWIELDLDVSGLGTDDEPGAHLSAALLAFERANAARLGRARAVGVRLNVVGEHKSHEDLARKVREDRARSGVPIDARVYFLERVRDDARTPVDLVALARGDDPPGLFARRILALERGDAAGQEIVSRTRRALQELSQRPPWSGLEDAAVATVDDARARDVALRAARAALEALLAQSTTRPTPQALAGQGGGWA